MHRWTGFVLMASAIAQSQPLNPTSNLTLDTNATRLSNKNDDVKENAEQEEPLPTQKRGELATRRTEDATRKFREEALPAFEKRTEDFDRFFSNADRVPEASEFYSQYVDKIDGAQGLRKTYRAKYKLAEIDDERIENKDAPLSGPYH